MHGPAFGTLVRAAAALALAALLQAPARAADAPPVDPATGLVVGEHWELVRAHCTVCHSAQLVTQQRGSRDRWLQLIRWMQATQGLWQFDPATEAGILDYLASNYAPAATYRRAPLPPELLPPRAEPGGRTGP